MKVPLVVIGGLGAPRAAASLYARVVRGRRRKVATVPQSFLNFGDIRGASARVDACVRRVLADTGADKVDLVGMSLGGLIGLYYVKCGGGAGLVRRFVSVGGPLNGHPHARLSRIPPLRFIPALRQVRPESAVLRAIREAPNPEGVRMYSVGTRGDVVTPRAQWEAEGLETVKTPHGVFPVGHWCLFLLPGNHRAVRRLIDG
jgi:pimeloyl-ACP methyl ester carboxylesterase